MLQTEATVRRTGALVALAAASGLVLMLVSPDAAVGRTTNHAGVPAAVHAVFLLGCAAVLLSPAHQAAHDLARGTTTREFFGAPARAASKLWTELLLVPLFERRPCTSAASSGRATWHGEAEATMRRYGALVALAASALLVLLALPGAAASSHWVMLPLLYTVFLLGCAAVLLSPAHRAVAELIARARARLSAAEAAREIRGGSARVNMLLRWAGFACISFCTTSAAAADVNQPAEEVVNVLLLFLLFLVSLWAVSLSMLAAAASDPAPLPLWQPPLPPQPLAADDRGNVPADAGAADTNSGAVSEGLEDFLTNAPP